tara:strand:- start:363 stop:575 length:213 start_codon:yes stop_codon:yes gene_type:complete
MNAITFAVALGVIGMVGNLLVHLVNNDITGVGDFLAWMVAVGIYLAVSYLIFGLIILSHKDDMRDFNLNN